MLKYGKFWKLDFFRENGSTHQYEVMVLLHLKAVDGPKTKDFLISMQVTMDWFLYCCVKELDPDSYFGALKLDWKLVFEFENMDHRFNLENLGI